jgi:hypothetical protein
MTKEALHGNSPARGRERRAAPFDSVPLSMWRATNPGDINFGIDLAFFANFSDRIAFRIGSVCGRMTAAGWVFERNTLMLSTNGLPPLSLK